MQAHDFSLKDQNGDTHSLADYKDGWLVLYFYPKDSTYGCTAEACNFRDARDALAEFGHTKVVGISADSSESHKKFSQNNKLNFTLLSDPSKKTIKAYDSWGILAANRNTFIINPSGEIVKEYKGVEPSDHIQDILADLQALQGR